MMWLHVTCNKQFSIWTQQPTMSDLIHRQTVTFIYKSRLVCTNSSFQPKAVGPTHHNRLSNIMLSRLVLAVAVAIGIVSYSSIHVSVSYRCSTVNPQIVAHCTGLGRLRHHQHHLVQRLCAANGLPRQIQAHQSHHVRPDRRRHARRPGQHWIGAADLPPGEGRQPLRADAVQAAARQHLRVAEQGLPQVSDERSAYVLESAVLRGWVWGSVSQVHRCEWECFLKCGIRRQSMHTCRRTTCVLLPDTRFTLHKIDLWFWSVAPSHRPSSRSRTSSWRRRPFRSRWSTARTRCRDSYSTVRSWPTASSS